MQAFFWKKLDERVRTNESLLCIGLDPHAGQLATFSAEDACVQCVNIVAETSEYAAAFKPNIAFFEQFGAEGIEALKKVVSEIPPSIPIVLDCKRGDIDTTAIAYAAASYNVLKADAVTLSPYMGWDTVKPFVTGQHVDKGAFVLCKTSNPSANEVQGLKTAGGKEVFEKVAERCVQWNEESRRGPAGSDCVGLVAGATDLAALRKVRAIAPDIWILCPGVGVQGGTAEDACDTGLRADGSGLLVSVSRGISGKAAAGPGAMAAEACRLRDEINALRKRKIEATGSVKAVAVTSSAPLKAYQREFIELAMQRKALKFGTFALKSGRISPYFFNAGTFSTGSSLHALGRIYAQAIRDSGLQFDVLFGPAYKGIPLVSAAAASWYEQFGQDVDVAYNRKEAKDHGEGGLLVGAEVAGCRVLLLDDVITAGTAIRASVELLRAAGAVVVGVVVCLDRQECVTDQSITSAVQEVEREFGFPVISIVGLQHLIDYLQHVGAPAEGEGGSVGAAEVLAYRERYGIVQKV